MAYDAQVLQFDHVIVPVEDLAAAAARFQDHYGLGSVEGGRHVGHGTANRLVPLGPDYLELVAVVDPDEARGSPFGRWVAAAAADGGRGLCLRSGDLDRVAERLGLTTVSMSRVRPDGLELSWRLAGMEALARGLPFFIDWDVPAELHPGASPAAHRSNPRGIVTVEVGGAPTVVRDWIGPSGLDIRLTRGAPGVGQITIATESGGLAI